MIPFNRPPYVGKEIEYIEDAVRLRRISGDGKYTKLCTEWFETQMKGASKVLLTTSCTHALEMAALLSEIRPGDEIIMPSFTFVSTADAFVLRGARIVFVDIRPDTMNINEKLIERAITKRTKAIVPVHYAGVACEMDTIMDIARRHNLLVIEDAAQGVSARYKGQILGTIGDYGCYSFHETKNYSMGEGGAIIIKNMDLFERAEVIREKGTNRSKFFRGEIDKYTWVDAGSSYLPSELNAAYLYAQLEEWQKVFEDRMRSWNFYKKELADLEEEGKIELPVIPKECEHNAHIFYIKTADLNERTQLISYLRERNIHAVFHYIPLHSAPAGRKYGRFSGEDIYTTTESNRLLRLPLYYGMMEEELEQVVEGVKLFYRS